MKKIDVLSSMGQDVYDAINLAKLAVEWYEWDKKTDESCMEFKTWQKLDNAFNRMNTEGVQP